MQSKPTFDSVAKRWEKNCFLWSWERISTMGGMCWQAFRHPSLGEGPIEVFEDDIRKRGYFGLDLQIAAFLELYEQTLKAESVIPDQV